MVTSSTPTPMPAIRRHRLIAGAVVCSAMTSVAAEYQRSETVKTVRRPYLSARPARKNVTIKKPANAEERRGCRGIEAAINEARTDVRGEKQVVEFEPAADGQQEHEHPDGTRRRQPVDARIDARRCFAPTGA